MKAKKAGKYAFGCVTTIFLALFLAVYFVNKPDPYIGNHPTTNGNTVSILLIDGLSQQIFEEAIQQQKLPNLKRLMDDGTYVENGIGSFPSMTGYAFYPFITGVDASKSGILGLRWFDRSLDTGNLRNYVGRTNVYMNQDITDTIKNIFELSGDMYTASINSYMNRGVDDGRMTGWAHTTAKFEGKSIFGPMRSIPLVGEELAKNHFQHETNVIALAKQQLEKNPKVQWITLPSLDASHHVFGMTDNYHKLLKHIDSLIGEFRSTIDSLGQSESRMIAVITDHGISDVEQNIDIEPLANEKMGLDLIRGNAVNYRSMLLDAPLQDFIDKDGYWVINGNLSAYLYMRDPNKKGVHSWRTNLNYEDLIAYKKEGKTINIPESICDLEGIQLVIYRKNDSTIVVQNREGFSEIVKKEYQYKYVEKTADPFSYTELSLVDTFMTKEDWISKTIDSPYPDAVYRLYTLMEAPNIGDFVITSEEGFDLAKNYEAIVNDYRGGHGGLRGDQLRVPYIIYKPGSNAKVLKYSRAEEIGIIIKEWLGFSEIN